MTAVIRYFGVDGYHGGKYGHMPLGTWRDILRMLEAYPEWKLSLDIEPVSWDELRQRDPQAYRRIAEMLREDPDKARLEIVAPAYAQPYPWLTDGESLIRQLQAGMAVIHRHFPWLRPDTYAVQEPCWTSAMPQILRSMGYRRACLKDASTAWSGYCAGLDADVCLWTGPDGSQIPAVPRYACEELLHTWQTESCGGEREFTDKCNQNGVNHPAGMYFQDLGWPAYPYMRSVFLKNYPADGKYALEDTVYTTWREYMEKYAGKPEKIWRITQEDFRTALPWGDAALTRMARQVRRGEAAHIAAEKLNALRRMYTGTSGDALLKEAARQLMLSQHHDAWICASCGEGENNWAAQTCARIFAARSILNDLNEAALGELSAAACGEISESPCAETVLLYNTLGRQENVYAEIPLTCDPGVRGFRVRDGQGRELPCQMLPSRTYWGGAVAAGTLLTLAPVEGLGAAALQIEHLKEKPDCPSAVRAEMDGRTVRLESDLYDIRFDLDRGGCVSSWYMKAAKKQIVDASSEAPFLGYRGYFIKEARFISSAEAPAAAEILTSGPLHASLRIKGKVGDAPFTQEITLRLGDPVVHVQTEFDFPEKTQIGDPHVIRDEESAEDRHRSYHDGRYKLNACFPTAFPQRYIHKDAAYDVCRSRQEDTFFTRWDDIRHNILVSWVDAGDGDMGLTLFSDETTSYVHGPEHPLGLTMAWAGDGGYWWRHRMLGGKHSVSFGVMPHQGDWRRADVWHEGQKMQFPPFVQRLGGKVKSLAPQFAAKAEGGLTEISYAGLDGDGRMLIRLFNPGEDTQVLLTLPDCVTEAHLVELDGREIAPLSIEGGIAALDLPAFGLRTVRCTL